MINLLLNVHSQAILNLNGIRPADKIDPAREYVIRPAKHLKFFYEIRKVNVNKNNENM